MCRPDIPKAPIAVGGKPQQISSAGFLSVDAFASKPSLGLSVMYASAMVAFLAGVERLIAHGLDMYQYVHPILENETNRLILARHIGVDALSCFTVSLLGLKCFNEVCPDYWNAAFGRKGAMPVGAAESRMFTYHPAAFRVSLAFFSYQVKNMYDTLVWHDGPEFIFHHVLCMAVAFGCLKHGISHYHVPFFFGISEISTGILCLLANFDDHHGVPGLADAFPAGKTVLGAVFAVAFLVCRVGLWTFFSYYCGRDLLAGVKGTGPRHDVARPYFKLFLVALTGLTLLQILWLGQIIMIGKEELEKAGLL